ncbi:MAG: site-specific DNA-methyltransferase [Clostridia bacterium]|nr:site-specific DNA-methyltransferase [Clostridia bacterium]
MYRKINCVFCGESFYIDEYIEHLEIAHAYHSYQLENYMNIHLEKCLGEDTKKILELRESKGLYTCKNSKIVKDWSPDNFNLETTTIWGFPDRGKWATHNGKYRGNWSPYIPRNLILRYTEKNDVVLDQFLGSGTTLIETKLLERHGIGVDINSSSIEIAKTNLYFEKKSKYEPIIYNSDARNLSFIESCSIDLVCTHPPYSNIIKYSENLTGDLSRLDVEPFIKEMGKVATESFRVLKNNKYCAILMGDIRRKKHIIPLGFKVMQEFINSGFVLKEIVIKEQHNCKTNNFWYGKSIEYNFLLISHEYLFIFRKPIPKK